MEMTMIKVAPETRKKLQLIKQNLGLKSADEVINKSLNLDKIWKLSGSGFLGEAKKGEGPAVIKTKREKK